MNIETDPNAKCFSKREIFVNAPLEQVFNTIIDINNWPYWQSSVNTAHIDGSAEPGKHFVWKANGFNIKSRLHTVLPYSEIGWTGEMWWLKVIHNWFLSSENNRTRVIVKESMNGFGSSFLRKTLDDSIAKCLQELKIKAEKSAKQAAVTV